MTVEIGVHTAKNLPPKWSTEVFTEYQWIDDNTKWFETIKTPPQKKVTNPKWKYSA